MHRIKKFLVGSLLGLSLLAPLAATPKAEAHDPPGYGHQRTYAVYYRESPHHQWIHAGNYVRLDWAQEIQAWFRLFGYQAFIR